MPEFHDVSPNQRPSASNQNALHATVRDLQARPLDPIVKLEFTRLDASDLYASRPDANDEAIGTAIVDVGKGTRHALTTTDEDDYLIEQTDSEVKRMFPNVAQRIYSRDDVVGLLSQGSRYIPIQLGGSVVVWAVTQSTIAKATAMLTPTFGNADVVDWNAGGTALEATGQTVRLANMDWYSNGGIPADVLVAAIQYGKVYVIQTVFCGTV